MQNYLVQLWLNEISCECLICCSEVQRNCGLTMDVIFILPFTYKVEEVYMICSDHTQVEQTLFSPEFGSESQVH